MLLWMDVISARLVLPDAQVKSFLTASAGRTGEKRRYKELLEKGNGSGFVDDLLREIKERDYHDSQSCIAPLVPANDAVIVDTS